MTNSALYGQAQISSKNLLYWILLELFIWMHTFHETCPFIRLPQKFNIIWISSCHLNTIEFFTFKKINLTPLLMITLRILILFFFSTLLISLLGQVEAKILCSNWYTHHTRPLSYQKGQWTFKGWKFDHKSDAVSVVMLDDVNKSFLKIKSWL